MTESLQDNPAGEGEPFDPGAIERPDAKLLTYYTWIAALSLIAFPLVFLPLYFKYRTLRYKFDDKGVSMSWGLLFRRETHLTYRRIQDIHVTRNLFHRWLGLADVAVQTASGSAGAEMTIEGVRNPEALRDFLYQQMRGVKEERQDNGAHAEGEGGTPQPDQDDEALALLTEIRDLLKEKTTGAEHLAD